MYRIRVLTFEMCLRETCRQRSPLCFRSSWQQNENEKKKKVKKGRPAGGTNDDVQETTFCTIQISTPGVMGGFSIVFLYNIDLSLGEHGTTIYLARVFCEKATAKTRPPFAVPVERALLFLILPAAAADTYYYSVVLAQSLYFTKLLYATTHHTATTPLPRHRHGRRRPSAAAHRRRTYSTVVCCSRARTQYTALHYTTQPPIYIYIYSEKCFRRIIIIYIIYCSKYCLIFSLYLLRNTTRPATTQPRT